MAHTDVHAEEPVRKLALGGCFNFRDLGGYRTEEGKRLRWRRLFRADGLTRLDAKDCAVLDELGLATVIDLRTSGEIDTRGRFPIEVLEVGYHHLPLMDVLPPDRDLERYGEPEFVTTRYRQMFEEGSDALTRALRLLAEPTTLPAVFHCSAGKDRTGVLAALVLAFVGVPAATIVEDYALSGAAMLDLLAWLESENPDSAQALARYAPAVTSAPPESMAAFLALLEEDYGGFDGVATALDVTDAVAILRTELLEDDPSLLEDQPAER